MSSIATTVNPTSGALPGYLDSVSQVSSTTFSINANTASISASFNKTLAKSTFLIYVCVQTIPNTEVDASVSIQIDGTTVGSTLSWHGTSGMPRLNFCFPFFVASSTLAKGSHTLTFVSQVVSSASSTNQIYSLTARISEFGSLT